MAKRENCFVESMKFSNEFGALREAAELQKIEDKLKKDQMFKESYYNARDNRELKLRRHGILMEAARNDALATAIKAIYIEALDFNALSDESIALAETMVDNFIKEKGGASKILSEKCNNTYFLSRLTQIVEDAAKEEVEKVEKVEKGDIDFEDVKVDDLDKDAKEAKPEDTKDEAKPEDTKDEAKPEDTKDAEEAKPEDAATKELEKDPMENVEDDAELETPNDDDDVEDSLGEPIDQPGDDDNSDITIDGEVDNTGKVFKELEKEPDVKRAVEIIRQRIADAEESFIKNNAEDKKQIDELLNKISDNVKTVEDIADDDDTRSKIASESVNMSRRKISNITENRTLTVYERMTRNISSNIIKNDSLKDQYLSENGSLNTESIMETAKVMYGFLETINTLQLEKVDAKYIATLLDEMKE